VVSGPRVPPVAVVRPDATPTMAPTIPIATDRVRTTRIGMCALLVAFATSSSNIRIPSVVVTVSAWFSLAVYSDQRGIPLRTVEQTIRRGSFYGLCSRGMRDSFHP
jgi:hypothetical protein